ncbi:MAG: hypothetical protein ACR2GW_15390 [Pyrinomonadaceae bacterium]|nr:hypothetical protein [Pyrinomonadaceae bacterium]
MKRKSKRQARAQAVERTRRLLLRQGWPRLQMTLMLLLTGCAGFLVSFVLLRAGLTQMWLRYPVAILAAYAVFLLLLRVWLSLQRPRESRSGVEADVSDVGFDADVANVGFDLISKARSGGGHAAPTFGGGGDFGGGGAGGSWAQSLGGSSAGGQSGVLGDLDLDFGDEGCGVIVAVIALLAAIIGGLLITLYVVYAAPALLAEILVDGLLVGGLYKSLKDVEQRHWLRTAVSKTLLPMLLALALFILVGYVVQRAVPEAHSVGDIWKRLIAE